MADEGNDYIYVMGGYYNKYKAYQYKVRDLINRESVIQFKVQEGIQLERE